MPRKQSSTPSPLDRTTDRLAGLPDNPFLMAEALWTDQVFGGIVSQLESAIQETQRKLGEAWEQGARAGYDLGFQTGAKETEAELRTFYEQALTEQETKAARELEELGDRLRTEHEAELSTLRESTRREIERLSTEQAAKLANLEDSVRRETELELQHRFSSELAQAEARVRREAEQELRATLETELREGLERELRASLAQELSVAARRDVEQDLQQRFSEQLHEVEERVRRDTEQAMRAAFEASRPERESGSDPDDLRAARAEGYTQGLNESARRYEEAMSRAAMERREAAEAAYRKGFDEAQAQTEKELKAAYQEGYRQGLQEAGKEFAAAAAGGVPAPLLDEARRQAYENGYEDGRSVGLSRGRRQAEAEQVSRLQEATRIAYREGFLDGKRTVADAERSWAFGVLHLPPDATAGEVKQHYKRLSMALHPDQNPQLADVFIKNLNRAKQLLDA